MINIYKQTDSANAYANLFIPEIPDNAENVCLLFIGHLETVYNILSAKPNVNFTVIDGSDTTDALPYIYNGDNLKERITFEDNWCEDNDTFIENLQTIFNNMSFDLIIANPPYGKSQELIKKILKSLLSKERNIVCLGPDNTFKDDFLRSKLEPGFDFVDPKELFGLDTGGRLIIAKLNKDLDDEKDIEDIFLDKKAATLLKAISKYNSKVERTFWNIDGNSFARKWNYELKDCNKKEQFPEEIKHKKFCECVEEGNLFFKPLFWPCISPKGLVDSYEGQYNIQGKWLDVFNEKRAGDVLVFKNKKERDNFYKWTTQHYGPNYTWIDVPYDNYLCGYIRKAIRDLIGQGAGASFFTKYLPQVDWSRSWTDQEILKELGLPEDFLEKEV
jgi:hypothetical protein